MPNFAYIYIVTESDLGGAQGLLAQFNNLDNGTVFYSQDAEWQVSATGRRGYAPYNDTLESFKELNEQIQLSN